MIKSPEFAPSNVDMSKESPKVEIVSSEPPPANQEESTETFEDFRKEEQRVKEKNIETYNLSAVVSSAIIPLSTTTEGVDAARMESLIATTLKVEATKLNIPENQGESLAKELVRVEMRLIAPFAQQIYEAYKGVENKDLKKIDTFIGTIRESLYSLAISNIASGEKLTELISAINFVSPTGPESKGDTQGENGIVCFYSCENGQRTINIQAPALEMPKIAQLHVTVHEISHLYAESTDIWQPPGVYEKFLASCRNPTDEAIGELAQHNPALAHILKILQKPTETLLLWNHYIRKRLKRLDSLPEGEPKATERVAVGRELVAEMMSSYLLRSESEGAYFLDRLKFSTPGEIIEYLKDMSHCSSDEEFSQFCLSRGVNPQEIIRKTPTEFIHKLATIEEFAPLFRANQEWYGMLQQYFNNRSVKISPVGKAQRIDEIAPFVPKNNNSSGGSNSSGGEASGTAGEDDTFAKLWDFVTGKPSKGSII